MNRIKVVLNNRGSLSFDIFRGGGAFLAPGVYTPTFPSSQIIVYDQGPWIIGKIGGQPAGALVDWGSSFASGPIIGGQPALRIDPGSESRYHAYKITTGDNGSASDYAGWPADLGAPLNNNGMPRILGNQTVWCVYNGADSTYYPLEMNEPFPRLPVEVRQTAFARAGGFSDASLLASAVMFEWTFNYNGSYAGQAGYVFSSGPFTFAPADTQWMMVALLPVDKGDFRESIRTLRDRARRLRALPYDSLVSAVPLNGYEPYMPAKAQLLQNFPNPFNGSTTIQYDVSEISAVRLVLYDVLGRRIRTLVSEDRLPGRYSVTLQAGSLASGVYIVRLNAGSIATTKKIVIVR